MPDQLAMEEIRAAMIEDRRFVKRWLAILVTGFLCLIGGLTGLGVAGYLANHHRAQENAVAVDALCAVRRARVNELDRARRHYREAADFYHAHPHGFDGFTADLLIKGVADARLDLDQAKDTVKALGRLDRAGACG